MFTCCIPFFVWWFAATNAYIFYGGDITDERAAIACGLNMKWEDSRIYDDFDLPPNMTIDGLWMNALLIRFIPKEAYYEIRSGMSEHHGGELLASGIVEVDVLRTGRTAYNQTEYQIRAVIPTAILPPETYHLTFAPVGFGGDNFCYLARTLTQDLGPVEDPNPAPAGSPLGNGSGFWDSPAFGYDFEGPFPWDFSYGVGTLDTVATTLSLADSFLVTRGNNQSGGLYELWGRDDERLVIQQRPRFLASHPNAQVIADTATPVPSNPNRNRVILTLESRCTGSPSANIIERIELFDFMSNAWVVVSEQPPSFTDRQTVVDQIGRFVEANTNRVVARISWVEQGAVANLNWSGQIDWILWEVFP